MEATINDISQMHRVQNAVKENVLSNPGLRGEIKFEMTKDQWQQNRTPL